MEKVINLLNTDDDVNAIKACSQTCKTLCQTHLFFMVDLEPALNQIHTPQQHWLRWWQVPEFFSQDNNRDTHGKDFQPIFDHFSLQFLFNFIANLTFFAVKLKEN